MVQQDCLDRRGKWISKFQEYDLELKHIKLIKKQGLAKLITERNEITLQMVDPEMVSVVLEDLQHSQWYGDIIYYLQNLSCEDHITRSKRRALRLNGSTYCLMKEGLGWRNLDGLTLGCVDPLEAQTLMNEMHNFVMDT